MPCLTITSRYWLIVLFAVQDVQYVLSMDYRTLYGADVRARDKDSKLFSLIVICMRMWCATVFQKSTSEEKLLLSHLLYLFISKSYLVDHLSRIRRRNIVCVHCNLSKKNCWKTDIITDFGISRSGCA